MRFTSIADSDDDAEELYEGMTIGAGAMEAADEEEELIDDDAGGA